MNTNTHSRNAIKCNSSKILNGLLNLIRYLLWSKSYPDNKLYQSIQADCALVAKYYDYTMWIYRLKLNTMAQSMNILLLRFVLKLCVHFFVKFKLCISFGQWKRRVFISVDLDIYAENASHEMINSIGCRSLLLLCLWLASTRLYIKI